MVTTAAAISLIKVAEGYRADAYFDTKGIPTIGHGTTVYSDGNPVQIGDETNHDDAERELFFHVRKEVEPTLEKLFGDVALQPNQRDALASFIYNLGPNMEGKYPTLYRMVHEGAPDSEIALQLVKYRDKGTDGELGLYRRRVAEALMWHGLPIDRAWGIELSNNVLDVISEARAESDLFEEPSLEPDELPETDPIEPNEGLPSYWDKLTESEQAEYLNMQQIANVTGEAQPPIRAVVDVQPAVRAVEIADVPYLDTETPMVKPIEESQRGQGFAKTEIGKQVAGTAVIGTAANSVGMLEPIVAFVDRYPKETIAWTFFGLLILGVICFYFGKWQRRKGENEATELLA